MHSFDAPGGTTFHFNGDLSGDLHISPEAPASCAPLSDVVALMRHWQERYREDLARLWLRTPPPASGAGLLLLGSDPDTSKKGGFW
jgi:hypothetical protein